MRRGIIAVALGVGMWGAGVSSGAEKTATVSGKATTEVRPGDNLKALVGTWSCDGTTRAGGTAQTYKSRFTNKWDLANAWLSIHYDQTAVKAQGPSSAGYLGWDANGKRYLYLGVDSSGGWVSLSVPDWNGSSLTVVGHRINGETKVPVRYTFTKGKTDRDMMFAVEVQDAVKWNLESQDTCRR